jgi:septum formation protein
MKQETLILASASPRRRELIRTLGLPHRAIAADVDETLPAGTEPRDYVERLSLRKAAAVAFGADVHPDESAIVIGSDTIVTADGNVLGKPRDEEDAFGMLSMLAGRTHQVYSGLAVIRIPMAERIRELRPGSEEAWLESARPLSGYRGDYGGFSFYGTDGGQEPAIAVGHCLTHVTMKPLTERQIRSYIRKGESGDKAGAYAIQGAGAALVERIEGDYFNVVGLPVSLLSSMLERLGVEVL